MKRFIKLIFLFVFFIAIQTISAQEYTAQKIFGQEQLAIREVRRNAVAANIGWNGLTGVGVTYHNYVGKQVGVDLGIGLASTGIKLGGRFRYLFMEKNFSPYLSGGFMYGLGFGNTEIEYNSNNNNFFYTIGASPYAQIAGGIEYLADKGFLFMFDLGYAFLLNDGNYEITRGVPSSEELMAMDMAFGSGIVIEFTIGYAFGGK